MKKFSEFNKKPIDLETNLLNGVKSIISNNVINEGAVKAVITDIQEILYKLVDSINYTHECKEGISDDDIFNYASEIFDVMTNINNNDDDNNDDFGVIKEEPININEDNNIDLDLDDKKYYLLRGYDNYGRTPDDKDFIKENFTINQDSSLMRRIKRNINSVETLNTYMNKLPDLLEYSEDIIDILPIIKEGKYFIEYGIGPGMTFYDVIDSNSEKDATTDAYYRAKETYDSYEGLHGIRTQDEIAEEEGISYDEAEHIYNDEVESMLDYSASIYDPEKHKDYL